MRLIGFMSQRVLDKAEIATSQGDYVSFTCSNRKTEAVLLPVFVGKPGDELLETPKQRTAQLVAAEQMKKLYAELTNGQPVGDDWGDGEYNHQGYVITNEQLERMRELLGIEL